MTTIIRADLGGADPTEVVETLRDASILSSAMVIDGAMVIETDATEAAVTQALSTYTPVAAPGAYQFVLPPGVIDHVQHLKDFRDAVRAGQTPTNAQTQHVIADIIDALRILVDRRLP